MLGVLGLIGLKIIICWKKSARGYKFSNAVYHPERIINKANIQRIGDV